MFKLVSLKNHFNIKSTLIFVFTRNLTLKLKKRSQTQLSYKKHFKDEFSQI